MKKVTIFKKDGITIGWGPKNFKTSELAQVWIDAQVAANSWGLPERKAWKKGQDIEVEYDDADVIADSEIEVEYQAACQAQVFEKDENGEYVLDENGSIIPALDGEGNPVSETIPAVNKIQITLRADYVVEIIDLDTNSAYLLEKCYAKRILEYGSIGDQLDMQYHDSINSTTTWKDHITAVKLANPLPE